MPKPRLSTLIRILFLFAAQALTSCVWSPPSALPTSLQAPPRTPESLDNSWWTTFKSAELNSFVDLALSQSLELQQAAARIRQADAQARKVGAALFPTVEAQLGATAERGNHTTTRSQSLGGLLRWEADLWGRLSHRRRASEEEATAAREDWLGARVLLTAAIAETYFQLVEEREQLALLREQIKTSATFLELTQWRFGQGSASIVDVLQQKEQLASSQALEPLTQASMEGLVQRLAALLGQPATNALKPKEAFPRLPEWRVPPSLPQALADRPDLRAMRHRLLALDHELAEALADRLPQFTLRLSTAFKGETSPSEWLTSAAAQLVGPLIDGGGRRAEVDRRRAMLEEAVHAYGQAYFDALSEWETAKLNEANEREYVTRLDLQLKTARRLLDESRNRYSQGLTDYLPLLTALERVQSLERTLLSNQRLLLSYRVQQHRALGGL